MNLEQALADHWHELVAYARRLTRSHTVADDILQDAAIRALRAWPTTTFAREQAGNLRAWFMRIIAHTYFTQYQRDVAESNRVAAFERECGGAYGTGGDPIDHRLDDVSPFGDEVQTAAARLGDLRWEILRRHYIEGQDYRQIARELGLKSQGTLASNLSRARLQLSEELADYAAREYGIRASVLGCARVDATGTTSEVVEADADGIEGVMGDVDNIALRAG